VSWAGRARAALLTSVALVGASAGLASTADASFHLMKIRAVFLGPDVANDVSFIELQMTADGQNFTGGHNVTIRDAAGAVTVGMTLTDVPNGQNQRTILIGDTGTAGPPDVLNPGLQGDLSANAGGGAVCFDTVDCFSWGAFTGDAALPSSAGTPDDGLSPSMVNARSITANCPTALDDADDTNNSQADFVGAVGFPVRNNAGTPTESACAPATPLSTPLPLVVPPKAAKKCKKAKKKAKQAAAAAKCKKKKKKK